MMVMKRVKKYPREMTPFSHVRGTNNEDEAQIFQSLVGRHAKAKLWTDALMADAMWNVLRTQMRAHSKIVFDNLNFGKKMSEMAYASKTKTRQLSKSMKIDVPEAVFFDDEVVALMFQDAKIRERNAKLVRRASTTRRKIKNALRRINSPDADDVLTVSLKVALESNRG